MVKKKLKSTDKNQDISLSSSSTIPSLLVDQVIGQPEAVQVIRQAAHQRRNILLLGQPGTGKSMLAKALADLLPQDVPPDILVYPNPEEAHHPRILTAPAGQGDLIVEYHRKNVQKQKRRRRIQVNGIATLILVGALVLSVWPGPFSPAILFFGIITAITWLILQNFIRQGQNDSFVPRLIINNKETQGIPFVDASGATAGALLGDVRHDPFQAGGLETPPHELVLPGLIHKANGGVLLIDEIGTLDLDTQFKLLTILQERKFPIEGQSEASSGSTIRTDFVPCDFVLVAAGNLETIQMLHPALRSRFQGFGKEVLMNESLPDNDQVRDLFRQFVNQEVAKDGKIPEFSDSAVEQLIFEARLRSPHRNHLSLRLRDLGGIIRAAGDIAVLNEKKEVGVEEVIVARQQARPLEAQISQQLVSHSIDYNLSHAIGPKVGQVFTLALFGEQVVILPIVVVIRPISDPDSRFEASCQKPEILLRYIQDAWILLEQTPEWPDQAFRVTVQILDYPQLVEDAFGLSIAVALYSAVHSVPLSPKILFLGKLAINGDILPIPHLFPRLEYILQSDIKQVIIPEGNLNELARSLDLLNTSFSIEGISSFQTLLDRQLLK